MSAELAPSPKSSFEPADWLILARHWFPIARSCDVGAAPHAAMLLDEPLVAYRVAGELVVARDLCPHRGVPLTLGSHDADGIVCRYHGLRYGSAGRCNRVPANPNQPIPSRLKLHTYAAVERHGLIWTSLGAAPETEADVPSMPHWDEADFQQIVCPMVDIRAFAGRQLEGFLDVAHFGWIHDGTFGDPRNTIVPSYQPVETPQGFEVHYRSTVGNYPIGRHGRAPTGFEWLRHFRVHLPFTATLTIHFPDDGRLVIMNAASPVSARHTRLFAPIARNFDKDLPVQDVHDYNLKIFEEDRIIVETQQPERLPLEPLFEAHIEADRSSMAYRRGLKRLGLGKFFLA